MKKNISKVSAFIHMMIRPAAEMKSGKMVFAENLPIAVKFFVQRNFPNRSIAFAEMGINSKGKAFEVTLNDGIQIGFAENGSWERIDCKTVAVPENLVPVSVADFLNAYYSEIPLVKIEKTANGYEATLSDFTTLKFKDLEYVA